MAALASSAVTVYKSGYQVMLGGARLTIKRLTLVLTGQGGATNTIDASTLGFTEMLSCSNATADNDGFLYPAMVSYDGSKVFLNDISNATDATRDVPTDITDTVRITITGYTA
jgi:hypothetical protein